VPVLHGDKELHPGWSERLTMAKKRITIRQAANIATESVSKLREALYNLQRALAIIEAKDKQLAELQEQLFTARAALTAAQQLQTLHCSDRIQ
jgi:hypothetical protein